MPMQACAASKFVVVNFCALCGATGNSGAEDLSLDGFERIMAD